MPDIKISHNETELVISTKGAELGSFKIGGKEFIWQKDEEKWGGSAPILFPIIGELKGEGKTTLINDKPYHMNIHGFVKDSELEAVKVGDDTAIFILESNDETRKQYPYRFTFRVKFRAVNGGFIQSFFITNNDTKPMPYFVGAHPGFIVPNYGDEYSDYTLEFQKPEHNIGYRIDENGLVDDNNFDRVFEDDCKHIKISHELFRTGAVIFPDIVSRGVRLINKEGKGIRVEFPDFDYLGIWEMGGEEYPYLCIEPWTGMNDCYSEDGIYEHKRGVRYIEPNKTAELNIRVFEEKP